MKKVNVLLGLLEDASEEAALAEVTKLKNRASGLETELKTLLASQVDGDLAKYSDRFPLEKREVIKQLLLKDRAGTVVVLEALRVAQTHSATLGGQSSRNLEKELA